MRTLHLTETEIAAMRDAWLAGMSILGISARFRHGTEQIRALAVRLEWPARGLREPLPAGHSLTWGLIAPGTPYPQAHAA